MEIVNKIKNAVEMGKIFYNENRGAGDNIIGKIILLSIAMIFVATLFFEGLNILAGVSVSNSNLTGGTLVLFGLIGLTFVLGLIILVLRAVGIKVI